MASHERFWSELIARWRVTPSSWRPALGETLVPVVILDDMRYSTTPLVLNRYGAYMNTAAVALEFTQFTVSPRTLPIRIRKMLTDTVVVDYGVVDGFDVQSAGLAALTEGQIQGTVIEPSDAIARAGTDTLDLFGGADVSRFRVDVLDIDVDIIVLPGQTFALQTFTVNQGLVVERFEWDQLPVNEVSSRPRGGGA